MTDSPHFLSMETSAIHPLSIPAYLFRIPAGLNPPQHALANGVLDTLRFQLYYRVLKINIRKCEKDLVSLIISHARLT